MTIDRNIQLIIAQAKKEQSLLCQTLVIIILNYL